jgi:ParB-like chromosome segregation protein Spo0J
MVTEVSIDAVKPAAYNPRKITKEQQQELCKSIRKFGLIVPILVNRKDNVIIAGHQRTKSYCTCRNWQFANYFETHMKRGIKNG